MPVNQNIPLEEQLRQLGFKSCIKDVKMYSKAGSFNFSIPQSKIVKNDSLLYRLEFENSGDEVKLKKYGLTLQSIKIPNVVINGIDTAKLEKRLVKADKLYNDYYYKDIPATKTETEIIETANRDIHQLFDVGGTAKEIAELLMFKFWTEHHYKQYVGDVSRLKENYVAEINVEWNNGKIMSADEAYNKAKENYHVPKIKDMTEEHVISDNLFEQAQFEISFGREWLAYNTVPYFLDKGDVYFFKHKEEAIEFSGNNISEYDDYKIIHVSSIKDFIQQIPYGKELPEILNSHLPKETNQQSIFNSQLKTNVMNNDNLQYLTDNIKYMGFGENLKADLEKNMKEGKADFQLHYKAEINKKPFEATLNFRKSDSTDMYFFNNYHASLEKNNSEKMEQTFYMNKGKGITSKEAFNLLDGRSVHKDLVTKEGQPYKAWIQLDTTCKDKNNNFEVKQFHENYGFDLKAAVQKFPISDLKEQDKEKALLQSLQKGNVQSVTIEKDGNTHKMFIEADPQYKKVNLYDANMKLVAKESIEKYQTLEQAGASKAVNEEKENDKKKELKQEVKPDKEKVEKKNDKTLLPKKRESTKKGLGIS